MKIIKQKERAITVSPNHKYLTSADIASTSHTVLKKYTENPAYTSILEIAEAIQNDRQSLNKIKKNVAADNISPNSLKGAVTLHLIQKYDLGERMLQYSDYQINENNTYVGNRKIGFVKSMAEYGEHAVLLVNDIWNEQQIPLRKARQDALDKRAAKIEYTGVTKSYSSDKKAKINDLYHEFHTDLARKSYIQPYNERLGSYYFQLAEIIKDPKETLLFVKKNFKLLVPPGTPAEKDAYYHAPATIQDIGVRIREAAYNMKTTGLSMLYANKADIFEKKAKIKNALVKPLYSYTDNLVDQYKQNTRAMNAIKKTAKMVGGMHNLSVLAREFFQQEIDKAPKKQNKKFPN